MIDNRIIETHRTGVLTCVSCAGQCMIEERKDRRKTEQQAE